MTGMYVDIRIELALIMLAAGAFVGALIWVGAKAIAWADYVKCSRLGHLEMQLDRYASGTCYYSCQCGYREAVDVQEEGMTHRFSNRRRVR